MQYGWSWIFLLAVPAVTATAQETDRWADFDVDRLWLAEETIFEPFEVTESGPLRQALDDGTVRDETRLLIVGRRGEPLALIQSQVAYHHVVQGEMEGEPWMVSF